MIPLYQSETAPKWIRGTIVGTYQLAITVGLFLASIVNNGTKDMDTTACYRIPVRITWDPEAGPQADFRRLRFNSSGPSSSSVGYSSFQKHQDSTLRKADTKRPPWPFLVYEGFLSIIQAWLKNLRKFEPTTNMR